MRKKKRSNMVLRDVGRRKAAMSLVDFVAERIRLSYTHEAAAYSAVHKTLPSNYRPGKNFDVCWRKCSLFMLRNELNPEACISERIRLCLGTTYLVKPNQLYSNKDLEFYRQVTRLYTARLAPMLESEQQIFENYLYSFAIDLDLSRHDQVVFCLLNEALDLSALFRYCMASRFGLVPVAKKYAEPAVYQYLSAGSAYLRAWGSLIPQNLARNAKRIRAAVKWLAREEQDMKED